MTKAEGRRLKAEGRRLKAFAIPAFKYFSLEFLPSCLPALPVLSAQSRRGKAATIE